MRKVMVTALKNVPGTREWKVVEKGEAVFHQFGMDYEEFENGPGNFSTAIVEWPDGMVDMVRAERIQFLTPNA